ncbi:M1 family metallopeptidase [Williamsia sterculiae]|uniref:Aminopeptidase N n=1 Tax=Williamsia sterculiae TaxID=1344003 RepID=A0A1N7F2H5_9NOCA|nr:M1 family metallopeptidase [Williamsia sterculiae]SIR94531.1 aminopeptidase [Williamsia sterculiae]
MSGKSDRSGTLRPLLGDPTDGIDPYLPDNGNLGYRVTRYDLDLEYKVDSNRLSGEAVITATTINELGRFALDLSDALRVEKITVNGKRPSRHSHRNRKLSITPATPLAPGAAMTIAIRYSGQPRPIRGTWGEVGWEELTEGALCANQPNGAASWFPCDDHPSSKAPYRISVTTDSPYYAVANGVLTRKRTRASQTTWTYDQVEPMATYLAGVQIGAYSKVTLAKRPVPVHAVLPDRLRHNLASSFDRQVQMMEAFREMFGPYPFPEYTVVITDDDLEIPLEAQGFSTFGANHCTADHRWERLIAHELAHQWFGNSLTLFRWQDIWLHEGFACYAEWLWSEWSGGPSAEELALRYHERLRNLSQDLVIGDPGPEKMFDDRVYKRGALTLHALRAQIGGDKFFELIKDWVSSYRYGTVTTGDFTSLAARHSHTSLDQLWQQWLFDERLPGFPYA